MKSLEWVTAINSSGSGMNKIGSGMKIKNKIYNGGIFRIWIQQLEGSGTNKNP